MDKDRVEERIHISKSNSFTWTEKLNCNREVFFTNVFTIHTETKCTGCPTKHDS